MSVEYIADLFADYGDFYIAMDTKQSCFLEFLWMDPDVVNNLQAFTESVLARSELGVVKAVLYANAPHFQSHDRFER